jgi:hypothetical protein
MMLCNLLDSIEANWQGEPLIVYSRNGTAVVLNVIGRAETSVFQHSPQFTEARTYARLSDGVVSTRGKRIG